MMVSIILLVIFVWVKLNSTEDLAVSNKTRQTSSLVAAADLKTLVGDNNSFASDLYQTLTKKTQANLIFSPLSISQVLAMTYAGAYGTTSSQIAKVLHFTLPAERLHPAFNALDLSLQKPAPADNPDEFQLNIANSLWGQKGFPYLSGYLDLLAENYGAGVYLTDYSAAPETSRQAINQWVSRKTNNKINELLAPGTITPDTNLTLVNAIYFLGKWDNQFDPDQTHGAGFNLLDGTKTTVSMMFFPSPRGLLYYKGPNYQAVELAYKGDQVAMTLIVPDTGHFSDVQKSISAKMLDDNWSKLAYQDVDFAMPRYKFETRLGLGGILASMGMPNAMDNKTADFSGMDGRRDLYIGEVIQKALIAVDEDGTEAAASTVVILPGAGANEPDLEVHLTIDRPFIFVIHDWRTHSILFIGQVVDPR